MKLKEKGAGIEVEILLMDLLGDRRANTEGRARFCSVKKGVIRAAG